MTQQAKHFEMFRDEMLTWRWSLVTDRGETFACSARGYPSTRECLAAIKQLPGEIYGASIFNASDGHWEF